ncbi:unnamed protein product [Amoebophrya sp. A25]|nr:unnamed protein product [Amoebophrya sp. A25]|eukprot:GSA25T00002663001.1
MSTTSVTGASSNSSVVLEADENETEIPALVSFPSVVYIAGSSREEAAANEEPASKRSRTNSQTQSTNGHEEVEGVSTLNGHQHEEILDIVTTNNGDGRHPTREDVEGRRSGSIAEGSRSGSISCWLPSCSRRRRSTERDLSPNHGGNATTSEQVEKQAGGTALKKLYYIDELCYLNGHCDGAFCENCLADFIRERFETATYMLPLIKCPACFGRVRGASLELWYKEAQQRLVENAETLMMMRCIECDESRTLYEGNDLVESSDDYLLDMLDWCLPEIEEEEDAGENMAQDEEVLGDASTRSRRATDNVPPDEGNTNQEEEQPLPKLVVTKQESAVQIREKLKQDLISTWIAFSNGLITPSDFLDEIENAILAAVHKGGERGQEALGRDLMQRMDALTVPRYLTSLQLVERIKCFERKAVTQLAIFRKYPKIYTLCCGADHCFKCKVGHWHQGMTCDEMQQRELDTEAQFCPECGIPTIKTDGCNEMICVCGAYWHWEGEET